MKARECGLFFEFLGDCIFAAICTTIFALSVKFIISTDY